MTTPPKKNRNYARANTAEIGDDLVIAKTTGRAGVPGTWVIGTINGHRFDSPGLSRARRMPRLRVGRQPHLEALAAIAWPTTAWWSTSTAAGTSARQPGPPRRLSISWPPAWPNRSTTTNPRYEGARRCASTKSPSGPPNTAGPRGHPAPGGLGRRPRHPRWRQVPDRSSRPRSRRSPRPESSSPTWSTTRARS